jgi:hypothetical protein
MAVYKKEVEETTFSTVCLSYIKGKDSANLGQFNPGTLALLYCTNVLSYRRYN